MGIIDLFKKEKKEEVTQKEFETIKDESSYLLVDANKEKIESNSFSFSLNDLTTMGGQFKEFAGLFQNANSKNHGLYKISNFKNPAEIFAFFNDPKNKKAIKELKKMGFNPATILITITLFELEKEIVAIKEISDKILSFLENEKTSEIEADIETLNRLINEYKYNWQDEQYVKNNHKQVMEIERSSSANIRLYLKEIRSDLEKSSLIMTNKTINNNLNELEKHFIYYRLSLYVFGFATFMDVMLLENFERDYLNVKKEEIEAYKNEYMSTYQEALKYVHNSADKSVQGNIISGIGSAGKAIGNLAEKVKMAKDKNIDTWFSEGADNLKNISKDMKDKFSLRFEDMKDSKVERFVNKIELISKMYNDTKDIYFDKEKIYLEMVK